jgi:phage repressor protein C with HTH and peptisase S24 domain
MSDAPDPELAAIDAELRKQGRSRADLGRLLGLDSAQVSRTFAGTRRLQRHEYVKVTEWLGLTRGAASHAPGGAIVPMPGLVPLFGWVGAASESRLTLAEQSLRGYVPMHPNQANVRDAFALEVADISMIPRYEPGEIIYIAPHKHPHGGQDCVVVTTANEGLLKRYIRKDSERLFLHQLNPDEDLTLAMKNVAALHTVVGRG